MLDKVQTVAVGLSGGADSVCLFDILFKMQKEYGFALKAIHVNHNLRGEEALSDCDFVRALCRKRGVPLEVVSADVSSIAKEKMLGLEECGRLVRYEAFKNAGCDKIAVAHTLSDSIETSLFNLTRGSSLSGVCGISPVRGNIIRPLIFCTRAEVLEYCRENKLDFVTDSSNLSDDYSRNFLRHNVVPLLKQLNPELEKSFLRFFESARSDDAFLEKMSREILEAAKCEAGYNRRPFLSLDDAVLSRCVRLILEEKMKKQVEARHIRLIKSAVKNTGKIQLSEDLYISVSCDIISFQIPKKASEPWVAEKNGNDFVSPFKTYSLVPASKEDTQDEKNSFDLGLLGGEPVMRSRRPQDRFTSAARGNTKTLKKLFNEMKIPPEEREKAAVLESANAIVWVEGVGTNKPFIVTDKTDNPVKIKIKEG